VYVLRVEPGGWGEKMRAQAMLEGGKVVEFEKDAPTSPLKEVI